MNYRKCNPLYGYRWLSEGIKLFFSQPWPWLALVGVSLLALLLLSLLPVLGLVAIFTLFPGVAAGFLVASRAAQERQTISFQHLATGFKTAARPLLGVGGLSFMIFIVALLFILMGWREDFQHLLQLMQSKTPDKGVILSAAQQLTVPSLMVLAMMLLLAMATWFAPALVLFRQAEARIAMRLSFRACLANFFPFLVFCLLLLLLDLTVSFLLRTLLNLLSGLIGTQSASLVAMFFTFPLVCAFLASLFAAAYVSYQDVFEAQPTPGNEKPAARDAPTPAI